jgi:hypothetical protein
MLTQNIPFEALDAYFCFAFFTDAQRDWAAALAISVRRVLVKVSARAFPPFFPPRLPISCIRRFRSAVSLSAADMSEAGASPLVTRCIIENALTFGSLLERFGIPHKTHETHGNQE